MLQLYDFCIAYKRKPSFRTRIRKDTILAHNIEHAKSELEKFLGPDEKFQYAYITLSDKQTLSNEKTINTN